MGLKTYRYKKDKIELVAKVIGTDEIEEQVPVCDKCGKYLAMYKELSGGVFSFKETGRISPSENEFSNQTFSSVKRYKCDQCGGLFCENCIAYIDGVYDDVNEENVGMIYLCEGCLETPNELTRDVLYHILENNKISMDLFNNIARLKGLFEELEKDVLDN